MIKKIIILIIISLFSTSLLAEGYFTNEDLTGKQILCGKVMADLDLKKINYFFGEGFEFISKDRVKIYYKNTLGDENTSFFRYKTEADVIVLEAEDEILNIGKIIHRKTLIVEADLRFAGDPNFKHIIHHKDQCQIIDGDLKSKVERLVESFIEYMDKINII